jgi:hypothetical protein
MIRLVTYRNFPVLDVQIERAYRRRRRITRDVVFLDVINEFSVITSLGKVRRWSRSRDWLRKLARAVDALDGAGSISERTSSRLVAANATRPARSSKRRRRAHRP